MTTLDRTNRFTSTSASYDPTSASGPVATPDPRAATAESSPPPIPESYGREASTLATQSRGTTVPAPAPLSATDCAALPDSVLDHQASALRNRLGKPVDYPERDRDSAELKNVEGELQHREAAKRAAAQTSHGGVMLCKRVADLPGKDIHGAEHWWLETTRKSVGMGPATGTVPGHGESLPESWDTKLVDHSAEPRTNCQPAPKPVDEDCVDRELQLGEPTGPWIPGLNDCHTIVKHVIDKCNEEAMDKAFGDVAH